MRGPFLFFVLLLVQFSHGDPISAVQGLISRVLPNNTNSFQLEVIPPGAGNIDMYELNSNGSLVVVRGSSGVALATGLHFYLKQYCHVQMSWTGDQLTLPSPLPLPTPATGQRVVPWSYYMNVCTVSYSSAWWDWSRWQREVDWMALNGVNLGLAFTGQEYVWQQTFAQFGVTLSDLETFFSGPAFLAWQRMGNLQAWAGPLTQYWIDSQMQLQLQIVASMREFGITTVLPAFAGHIPAALVELYPKANITKSTNWWGANATYCCDYLLQPTDPLYAQIGAAFITNQQQIYGTDHYYNCDTFNEMRPSSNNPTYLADSSRAVYQSMSAADPDAVWVMQGWLFVNDPVFWQPAQIQALLSGVDNQDMIILDLFTDVVPVWSKTSSYYGKPFIWNMLHNFGGNLGLYGKLPTIATAPLDALATPGSTMVGIGITMEGIDQNYVVYDLMLEMGWRNVSVDIPSWIDDFAYRRYGVNNEYTSTAWQLMSTSVYACPDAPEWNGFGVTKSLIELRPHLNMSQSGFMPTALFYDPTILVKAWSMLVEAMSDSSLATIDTFLYDLVDVTRQVLSNIFLGYSEAFSSAYSNGDAATVEMIGQQMIELIQDWETVLYTDSHFLFGTWISDALTWASSPAEELILHMNARNQVTLWGPTGNIRDYASKPWAGLIGSFYLVRWSEFVGQVADAVNNNVDFNQTEFDAMLMQFESEWQLQTNLFPTQTQGDTIQVVSALFAKYNS